jgi:AraC-like DNA-binding protein
MSWIDQAMTRDKQQADTARENSSQEMNNRTNELYTRFITMLYTYGLAERRVSWYANQMHITPAYLHHICSQAAGQSPQEIIGNMILREAKQRLSSPEASIKETAFALNFGSESSFCKFFKKLEGKTPSEYRSLN